MKDVLVAAAKVVATFALFACAHATARDGVAPSGKVQVPSAPPSASAIAVDAQMATAADARASAIPVVSAPSVPRIPLGTFGVDIVTPASARISPEENGHITVCLSPSCPSAIGNELAADFGVRAVLEREHGPAPATLADALAGWEHPAGSDAELTRLGDAVSSTGVLFALYTFKVRVGFRSVNGWMHTYKWISRVRAALPIDGASHIECTGYVEHRTTADDDSLRAVRDLCMSMRIRPPEGAVRVGIAHGSEAPRKAG